MRRSESERQNEKNGVIYARYSSHAQKDANIEQQVRECLVFVKAQGTHITATYKDRAVSGKTDRRPNFQWMTKDAEKRKFQYVVAWKSNRMGRNMLHYTGVYIYGDVRVEGGIPRIVDKGLFHRVQEMLKTKNNPQQGRPCGGGDYLLTGKLFCGLCKSPMVGVSGKGKNGQLHHYYMCQKRRQEKSCKKQNIQAKPGRTSRPVLGLFLPRRSDLRSSYRASVMTDLFCCVTS